MTMANHRDPSKPNRKTWLEWFTADDYYYYHYVLFAAATAHRKQLLQLPLLTEYGSTAQNMTRETWNMQEFGLNSGSRDFLSAEVIFVVTRSLMKNDNDNDKTFSTSQTRLESRSAAAAINLSIFKP